MQRLHSGVLRTLKAKHGGCGWAAAAGAASALLLTSCTFPQRNYSAMPDRSVISVVQGASGWEARPPDCTALYTDPRGAVRDVLPRSAFGCATYTNLAASVARPEDLIAPAVHAGAQSDTAVSAVERYRLDNVEPLRETETQQTNMGGK